MPAIRMMTPADRAGWDAFVDGHDGGSFFHRAGWQEVMRRGFGHGAPFLLAEEDDRIVGVLPLVHLDSRLFARSLVSTAFCVGGGPLGRDAEAVAALDAEAIALAERLKVDFLEYRCAPPRPEGWLTRSDLYFGFTRALDPDPEKNLLAIPRKQRAEVRKGIKLGLVGEIDDTVDRFYDLYAESVRNLGTPVFGKRYFRALKEVFGEACELLVILRDGQPVSALMSFYFRDQVLPYYAGGGAAARAASAHEFMYWDVMRRACANGVRSFDFGRSKTGTGSFAFKKNWGFVPQPLTYGYHGIDDIPEINPLNPKYRMFVALWRRLPLGVSKLVGPWIARSLG